MRKLFFIVIVLFLISCNDQSLEKNTDIVFAPTPPMGWNSWDCFGTTVSEEEVKANADYMAEHLKEFGWQYIVVDIQWYEPNAKAHGYRKFAELDMDEFGRLIPAVNRFPSSANGNGFKPLADYIHNKGLKLGIHIMRGIPRQAVKNNLPIKGTDFTAQEVADTNSKCPWNTDMFAVKNTEGGQAYYNSIIELYNSWGVDYIKADDMTAFSGNPADESRKANTNMLSKAIKNFNRPIVLSLSPGPASVEQAKFLEQNAQLWRISDDFWDKWTDILQMFNYMRAWQNHIGPTTWPDADMLPLGKIGIRAERGDNRFTRFTKDEQITLMSLWSMFKSPLMFGGNLPDNDEWTLKLISNEEVLAVNQHSKNNKEIYNKDSIVVWSANPKDSKNIYLGIFNINESDTSIALKFENMNLSSNKYQIRDLWEKSDIGSYEDSINLQLNKHGAKLLLLSL
ncbi:MAG: glycoside hydrolase family 27 protein [Ignavibacteriales bacterium]|nr:glycoside hydrolase family 27 protein [Ignavibacteriales bacterium]